MVLKYSNDVSRMKPLEKHQYCVDSITIEKRKDEQNVHIWIFISIENMCATTTATTTVNTLIHCTKQFGEGKGCYLFRMCIATKHIFHIDNELAVKSTPSLLGIYSFFIHSNRISFAMQFRVCLCVCVSVYVFVLCCIYQNI